VKPGTRFVIDALKAAEVILPQFRERHEMEVGDIRFTVRTATIKRPAGSRTDTRWRAAIGARPVWRGTASTRTAKSSRCERAGFDRIESFGSLSGEPFCLGSSRLVVLAERSS